MRCGKRRAGSKLGIQLCWLPELCARRSKIVPQRGYTTFILSISPGTRYASIQQLAYGCCDDVIAGLYVTQWRSHWTDIDAKAVKATPSDFRYTVLVEQKDQSRINSLWQVRRTRHYRKRIQRPRCSSTNFPQCDRPSSSSLEPFKLVMAHCCSSTLLSTEIAECLTARSKLDGTGDVDLVTRQEHRVKVQLMAWRRLQDRELFAVHNQSLDCEQRAGDDNTHGL
jgi:hypothetical protein